MTLDVYPGLFNDDLDAVAHRLDAAAALARADCGFLLWGGRGSNPRFRDYESPTPVDLLGYSRPHECRLLPCVDDARVALPPADLHHRHACLRTQACKRVPEVVEPEPIEPTRPRCWLEVPLHERVHVVRLRPVQLPMAITAKGSAWPERCRRVSTCGGGRQGAASGPQPRWAPGAPHELNAGSWACRPPTRPALAQGALDGHHVALEVNVPNL